jgi:hypothetical protein
MKTLIIYLLVAAGWVLGSNRARSDERTEAAGRAAVQKGLEFLDADTFKWREQRNCAACHHGPMFVWAAHVADARGYSVNKDHVAEITRWLIEDDKARVFPKLGEASEGGTRFSLAAVFVRQALNAAKVRDDVAEAGIKRTTDHLMATQNDDGSWTSPAGRPPFFESDATVTRLARLALLKSNTGDDVRGDVKAAVRRSDEWLSRTDSDESQQTLALDLWAGAASANDKSAGQHVASRVATLQALQRPDGGWSQAPGLESDAFATGQALFALAAADLNSDDLQVQRAIAFLAGTQRSDGTWQMKSRPDPRNERPARNLNPITYAGTAWAVMGIASFIDEAKPK